MAGRASHDRQHPPDGLSICKIVSPVHSSVTRCASVLSRSSVAHHD
jgi:hypothetical protein